MELLNCPTCNAIFVKNRFRDVCEKCYREEEKAYETVYQFLRKRENRAATMSQVVEATGVEEDLLYKFIRKGRLKLTQFPNLGYPCDRCGKLIREGRVCETCANDIKNELEIFESNKMRQLELNQKHIRTYYSVNQLEKE
jgi:flagellar operon protein (TIGR03826 family)